MRKAAKIAISLPHKLLRAAERRSFGQVIRERRRQLDLTQNEVARRIKRSRFYVGHLESDKRHPPDRVLSPLAEVLLLDKVELFMLANGGGGLRRPVGLPFLPFHRSIVRLEAAGLSGRSTRSRIPAVVARIATS